MMEKNREKNFEKKRYFDKLQKNKNYLCYEIRNCIISRLKTTVFFKIRSSTGYKKDIFQKEP
jgi:hypothetical protein